MAKKIGHKIVDYEVVKDEQAPVEPAVVRERAGRQGCPVA